MQKIRENLALILLALLPLHALLITVGTKLIAGPNQAPLTVLALWKEVLLLLIFGLCFLEWIQKPHWKLSKKISWCSGLFITLALLVSGWQLLSNDTYSIKHIIFGAKYSLLPIIILLACSQVQWSQQFFKKTLPIFVHVGFFIASYGIISYLLPPSWFAWLGYNELHSVYEASGPLAPFQQLGGMDLRRLQSTLSGPNQAGLWLLIPWTITLLGVFKNFKLKPILLFGLFDIALFLTFSRSAWVAAFVIFLILLWQHRNQYYPVIQKLLKKILWAAGITSVCVVLIASVLRPDSTRDHIQKPMAAIAEIIRYPLGQGLGAAGPASNRVNDTCLTFNAGADVTWAQAHPDLCIFVNNKQVQPEAACSCPNLPENWYLQMGIEFGLLGFVLWILLLWFILKERFKIWFISLPFLGVCIASMFLHSWESSAVMITMWLLIAASFYKSDSSSL